MDVLGLVVGNLIGGKLADRQLMPTLLGSLLLALVMGLMSFALHSQWLTVLFVALLGAASFATVPPLQMWVLEKAGGAGQSLASSFNIGAFNLGHALGAWLGGEVIDQGLGLAALPWSAPWCRWRPSPSPSPAAGWRPEHSGHSRRSPARSAQRIETELPRQVNERTQHPARRLAARRRTQAARSMRQEKQP